MRGVMRAGPAEWAAYVDPHLAPDGAVTRWWASQPNALPCPRCKGSGKADTFVFRRRGRPWHPQGANDGIVRDIRPAAGGDEIGTWIDAPCDRCAGRGAWPRPDLAAILADVRPARPAIGGVRAKRPDPGPAYDVWRWIRFDSGADVTLPVMTGLSGDPWAQHWVALAAAIAAVLTGDPRSAGAARWAASLGGDKPGPGLPATAYPGGPAAWEYVPGTDPATDVALCEGPGEARADADVPGEPDRLPDGGYGWTGVDPAPVE